MVLRLDASESVLEEVAEFHVHADLSWRNLPGLKIRLFGDTVYPVIPCHTGECKGPLPETSAGVAALYSITPKTYAGLALQRQTVVRSQGSMFRAILGGVW